MNRTYGVCCRCVMDTSDPEIAFDSEGVCNHCKSYEKQASAEMPEPQVAERSLSALIERIRHEGRHAPYDCLIGVSGGVDSTMVAYLVRQRGLRPLAVHLDNGWDAELAVHNIETTLKRLGIDLFTHVIDWDEFRDLQLAFFRASVPNIEVLTDHAINAVLWRSAAQRNIRYVFTGSNVVTEGILPRSWMYDPRDLRHLKSIVKRFSGRPIRTFPTVSLPQVAYYVLMKGIKWIPILNYVKYNKAEAKALLQTELGWRDYGGKHYESIFTRFFQAYLLPEKFKMDKRRPHLSTLICSGQLTRREALNELEKPAYPPELFRQDHEFFLKKMNMTEDEFVEIMRLPIRSHLDYPSNRLLLEGGRRLFSIGRILMRPKELRDVRRREARPTSGFVETGRPAQ